MNEHMGDIVRQARIEKGYSQAALGERVGRSQRWISDLERGETKLPHLESLLAIATELDLDPGRLIVAGRMARSSGDASLVVQSVPDEALDRRKRICDEIMATPWEDDDLFWFESIVLTRKRQAAQKRSREKTHDSQFEP